ncbi:MAG: hypothetical protein ANABAC_1328 [Anaerolineae bacterium]|nr:MAG: hypothetical protein ANABAC_1328 [Anaerolineae bacterium]
MRRFFVLREDLLDVDIVAEGVEFLDGQVVLHWLLYPYSLCVYRKMEEVKQEFRNETLLCEEDDDGQMQEYTLAGIPHNG